MTNEKTFRVPAILSRISFTKDGGISLGFQTQEITTEEKIIVSSFYGSFGWLLFAENPISLSDLPKEQAEDKQKTPSKRLRATLFVLAQQKGIKDFEPYYREVMEKIISRVKVELD